MAELDPGVIAAVINANFKTEAERSKQNGDQWQNVSNQNAVNHQHALNIISAASVAAIVDRLVNLDVAEAAANSAITRSQSGQQGQDLGAMVASL